MKFGYIRISTNKQTTALQEDAMSKEQCDRTFTDTMSGKRFDRPEFLRMLDMARPGDIVVVWRLDRLGRSLKQLIETTLLLQEKGAELRSLKENIDTTTPTGKFMFHIIGAMAEFERDIIIERTNAGLEAARARGRLGGRKAIVIPPKDKARAKELWDSKQMSIPEIIKAVPSVKNKHAFYKYVLRDGKPYGKQGKEMVPDATG